jgi:hypothetical protein
MNMPVDKELLDLLKKAKGTKEGGTKIYFAFIPKGSNDGTLIISKAKIQSREVSDAKSEIGGGKAVTGTCYGDGRTLVFEADGDAPPAMKTAIKRVAKRETGLSIDPEVR